MPKQPTITLNDGYATPQLGLGVWQISDADTPAVVRTALAAGYRAFDTARIYGNERGVGEGVRTGGVAREDVFVTSKLWRDDVGYDSALRAVDATMDRLGLEYLDLYLIHWPAPARGQYADAWRALVRLREEGRVRSIGVSNFHIAYLERIIGESGVTPAVNQVCLHPRFQQRPLRAFHAGHGIATTAWAPLGEGRMLSEPAIVAIAARVGRTPAQVILRWHIQNGLIAIPKSSHPGRIAENFAVFDFDLAAADMAAIDALDDPAGRTGPDPANF